MVVTVVCYTATISLARKTVTLLRQYALQMSPKTLELQNQFGMALFAQVSFLFIAEILDKFANFLAF
jgi:hypothetical protein